MRELLIVGMDPGTTTAYAVLDSNGNKVSVKSGKKLELKKVIKEVTGLGTPLIVGSDRKKCPGMVAKFAAKTGAVIFCPDYDLSGKEKEKAAKGSNASNEHEKDAIATAKFAYKKYEPLLSRIRKTVAGEGKAELLNEVTKAVVARKVSIRKTLEKLQNKL